MRLMKFYFNKLINGNKNNNITTCITHFNIPHTKITIYTEYEIDLLINKIEFIKVINNYKESIKNLITANNFPPQKHPFDTKIELNRAVQKFDHLQILDLLKHLLRARDWFEQLVELPQKPIKCEVEDVEQTKIGQNRETQKCEILCISEGEETQENRVQSTGNEQIQTENVIFDERIVEIMTQTERSEEVVTESQMLQTVSQEQSEELEPSEESEIVEILKTIKTTETRNFQEVDQVQVKKSDSKVVQNTVKPVKNSEFSQQVEIVRLEQKVQTQFVESQKEPEIIQTTAQEPVLNTKKIDRKKYFLPRISNTQIAKFLHDKAAMWKRNNSPLVGQMHRYNNQDFQPMLESIFSSIFHSTFNYYFNSVSLLTKSEIEGQIQTKQYIQLLE